MQKKYYFVLLAIVGIGLLLPYAHAALAFELNYPVLPGVPDINELPATPASLPIYLAYVFMFLIGIAGTIAILSIAIAGFEILIRGGSPAAVTAARERIISSILGIVLLFASFIILRTINPEFITPATPNNTLEPGVYFVGLGNLGTGIQNTIYKPATDRVLNTSDPYQINPQFTQISYVCSPRPDNPGKTLLVWTYNLLDLTFDRDNLSPAPELNTYRIPCGSKETVDISFESGILSFFWSYEDAGVYYYANQDCEGISTNVAQKVTGQIPGLDYQNVNDNILSMRIVSGTDPAERYGVVLNKVNDGSGECSNPIINPNPGSVCFNVPPDLDQNDFQPLFANIINPNPAYSTNDEVTLTSDNYFVTLQEKDPFSPTYIGRWYTFDQDPNSDSHQLLDTDNDGDPNNGDGGPNHLLAPATQSCDPTVDPTCPPPCDPATDPTCVPPPPGGLGKQYTEGTPPAEECTNTDPNVECLDSAAPQGAFYIILYQRNDINGFGFRNCLIATEIQDFRDTDFFDANAHIYRMDVIPAATGL